MHDEVSFLGAYEAPSYSVTDQLRSQGKYKSLKTKTRSPYKNCTFNGSSDPVKCVDAVQRGNTAAME